MNKMFEERRLPDVSVRSAQHQSDSFFLGYGFLLLYSIAEWCSASRPIG
jgi:hypothetical protein